MAVGIFASAGERVGSRWAIPSLVAAALLLSVAAAGTSILPDDIATARAVQGVTVSGAGELARVANWAGSAFPLTLLTAAIALGLVLAGRFVDAALVAATLGARAANPLLKAIAESPRPSSDLVRVIEHAPGLGFPSGHAMSAVLVYGGLAYVARQHVRHRWLRPLAPILAGVMIALIGFGRIYAGAHWPSDVLGGYLWGAALLLVLIRGQRAARGALAPVDGVPAAERIRSWKMRRYVKNSATRTRKFGSTSPPSR